MTNLIFKKSLICALDNCGKEITEGFAWVERGTQNYFHYETGCAEFYIIERGAGANFDKVGVIYEDSASDFT